MFAKTCLQQVGNDSVQVGLCHVQLGQRCLLVLLAQSKVKVLHLQEHDAGYIACTTYPMPLSNNMQQRLMLACLLGAGSYWCFCPSAYKSRCT